MNEQDSKMVANEMIHKLHIEHDERMNQLMTKSDLALIEAFGLKPFKDGDCWCVLFGDNLQEGISGFGKSPHKAVLDFNKNWYNEEAKPEIENFNP